jgi:hypothetical protein
MFGLLFKLFLDILSWICRLHYLWSSFKFQFVQFLPLFETVFCPFQYCTWMRQIIYIMLTYCKCPEKWIFYNVYEKWFPLHLPTLFKVIQRGYINKSVIQKRCNNLIQVPKMITPSQSNVPCTMCTCPISPPMTRTRVVARHVTSPAAVCPGHTSVPLLTQISYHEDCF